MEVVLKLSSLLLLTCAIALIISSSNSAPLNVVNVEEIQETEEVVEDDDFTTHTLDRLSSAATCLVAGVEYTHGQQIYRDDPCEFCLCLDGEMFCWWQDCPPTLEGPCRDRLPFSPCANGPKTSATPKIYKLSSTTQRTSSSKVSNSITTETIVTETINTSSGTTEREKPITTTIRAQPLPKVCIVMGKEYEIGASLPHDTGNCVECICGAGAQVTCSPHQCGPPVDDINDYRPPGPRPPLTDTF